MPVQCRTRNQLNSTGLEKKAIQKFAGVLYVFLNTARCTFYVLMPEDYEETGKGGGGFGGAVRAKNQKHAIVYGDGSVPARTEAQAWAAVAERIVELLPRSKVYAPSLSPNHAIEVTGVQIIQRVVAQHGNIYEIAEMSMVQSSASDMKLRGENTQVKSASKTAIRSTMHSAYSTAGS
jgi:hypothetical protein